MPTMDGVSSCLMIIQYPKATTATAIDNRREDSMTEDEEIGGLRQNNT